MVHALYGLKSAGAAFQAHLASFMRQMGYTSCKADPDLWLRAVTRPEENVCYYAYILAMLMTYCAYTMTLCQLWVKSTSTYP